MSSKNQYLDTFIKKKTVTSQLKQCCPDLYVCETSYNKTA